MEEIVKSVSLALICKTQKIIRKFAGKPHDGELTDYRNV